MERLYDKLHGSLVGKMTLNYSSTIPDGISILYLYVIHVTYTI